MSFSGSWGGETTAGGVKTFDLGGHATTTEFTDAVVEKIKTKIEIWSSLPLLRTSIVICGVYALAGGGVAGLGSDAVRIVEVDGDLAMRPQSLKVRLERPSDFYALDKETLLEFDRIGDVSAQNMIASIERSLRVWSRSSVADRCVAAAASARPMRPSKLF